MKTGNWPCLANGRRVAVIGAGPAGIAAAIQLLRQGLQPIVFEGAAVGGLLGEAWLVENYPGFPGGIAGPKLAKLMGEQLELCGIEVIAEEVLSLESEGPCDAASGMVVTTASGRVDVPRAIVASGTAPAGDHGIAIAQAVSGRVLRGIRPLWGVKRARIVIVGGGDAAFDHAAGLAEMNDVTVVVRSDSARCIPILLERAENSPNIELLWDTAALSVGEDPDGSPAVVCESAGSRSSLKCDHVVLALGRTPSLAFVSPQLLSARARLQERGVLFFAGDVVSGACRQTAIAVGQGVMCAMRMASCALRKAE
ncbi:MAG: FAD-dependent oxidoreductase [Candidatus Eisenbacteria bacterium]|nr:FAD-dependent oxidoreductase [Candidatus Eisenbacteria bacterium]